jgi:hypothetical protein
MLMVVATVDWMAEIVSTDNWMNMAVEMDMIHLVDSIAVTDFDSDPGTVPAVPL